VTINAVKIVNGQDILPLQNTKRSKMLAPSIDLVGECGQTKVTKAKGTK
jgi:hypothetical protein